MKVDGLVVSGSEEAFLVGDGVMGSLESCGDSLV